MEKNKDDLNLNKISELLNELSIRVSRIESYLDIEPVNESLIQKDKATRSADSIELEIGEFWFAKVGITVLSIGIAFLLTLAYKDLHPILPSVIGYFIAATLFSISYFIRKSFDNISRYLLGSSIFILFFATLRLHFFSDIPAVQNSLFELLLLSLVVVFSFLLSVRRKSDYFSALSILMGFITALTSPFAYPLLIIILLVAGLIVFAKYKFQWNGLFIFGIGLTYITHLLWFINNPLLGNPINLVDGPQGNLFFILMYIILFALVNLKRKETTIEDIHTITSTFLNGFLGFTLILFIGLTRFKANFDLICYLTSFIFLLLAVYYWIREKSKYATFLRCPARLQQIISGLFPLD